MLKNLVTISMAGAIFISACASTAVSANAHSTLGDSILYLCDEVDGWVSDSAASSADYLSRIVGARLVCNRAADAYDKASAAHDVLTAAWDPVNTCGASGEEPCAEESDRLMHAMRRDVTATMALSVATTDLCDLFLRESRGAKLGGADGGAP